MGSGNKLFGKRIKELREAQGYTQEQLAEKVGLEYQTISRIETGYYFTSFDNLEKIAAVLKSEVCELFEYKHFTGDTKQEIFSIINNLDEKSLKFVLKSLKNFIQYKKN